ncbi:MAG TPA: hypothetical protein VKF14_08915 [Candidatus Dormibacteraeota bacterium]|nr:hypothetical protein [Candidatus Dormibacteraeota bacterium]
MCPDEALAPAAASPAVVAAAATDPEEGFPQVASVVLCSQH